MDTATVEPKENIVGRLLTKWLQLPLIAKLISATIFFSLLGTGLYFLVAKTSQIAFIENTPVTPPYQSSYPSPTPSPVASAAQCRTMVASAEISRPCSLEGFYNIKYQCDDGRTFVLGNGTTCLDLATTANQARQNCGTICNVIPPSPSTTASPTIRPSSTPKPASPKPSPSVRPSPIASSTTFPSPTAMPIPSLPPVPKSCYKIFGRKICIPFPIPSPRTN
ncbi:MAG: hypothetical protein WAV40_03615 [Microgenomates group bacterium]